MDIERLTFLSKLPLLLTSSMETQSVVGTAMESIRDVLNAQAVTVFVLSPEAQELTFWALDGDEKNRLAGRKMPTGKGIVGWVIDNQKSVLVPDAQNDPRFFREIDHEGGGFVTKNLICVPLTVRGNDRIGAIQVLNKKNRHL